MWIGIQCCFKSPFFIDCDQLETCYIPNQYFLHHRIYGATALKTEGYKIWVWCQILSDKMKHLTNNSSGDLILTSSQFSVLPFVSIIYKAWINNLLCPWFWFCWGRSFVHIPAQQTSPSASCTITDLVKSIKSNSGYRDTLNTTVTK